MTTSVELLAAQIENLRRQVVAMQSGSQLANSSIDNGQLLVTQNDGTGSQQVTTIVGTQYDGTSGAVVVAGPIPPVPGPPTLITAIGGVKVQWHGGFADPQPGFSSPVVAPLDFAGVDVEVSDDPGFPSIGFGTNHGTIVSAAGGEVFVSWPASGTPLYARLITRSKAGKFSNPGLTAGPTPSGQVQLGDLGFNITQFGGGTTIYYTVAPDTPVAPAWGFTVGDIWLQEVGAASGIPGGQPGGTPTYTTSRWLGSIWQPLQDQGISNSLAAAILAQSMAAAKAQLFTQPDPPIWSGAAGTAYWIDSDNGNVSNVWDGGQWAPFQIGNGAIQPNSLIASNVIATGSVTAALLEANMVLASTVIAGVVKGDHATMQSDGFHVFRSITGEGVVEVGRLATGSSNFLGIADATGKMVASIADDGTASFSNLNITNEPIFQGKTLSALIAAESPQVVGYFECFPPANSGAGFGDYGPITSRIGILEGNAFLTAGRRYSIRFKSTWFDASSSGASGLPAESRYYIQYTTPTSAGSDTAPTPSLASAEVDHFLFPATYQGGWQTAAGETTFVPTTTGRHRFLLGVELGSAPGQPANAEIFVTSSLKNIIVITDTGFDSPLTGVQTKAGGAFVGGSAGSTPPPVQQYTTGPISSSGHWTYRGNGTLRTDTSDVVQGWDPSGYNGDGRGGWNFAIPNITGTINAVYFYIYNNFSYFNSGGHAWISVVANANTPTPTVLAGPYDPGVVYPKPGPVTVTIPSAVYGVFTGKTSIGMYLGPIGSTNETYYIRADGPSALLQIVYTQ